MFTFLLALLPFLITTTISTNECCCCDVSNFYSVSRKWIKSSECGGSSTCCKIPTKDECELKLNPTFDGSCGHLNEAKYQKQHGGGKAQKIPRPGTNYDMYGWFGQQLIDARGNVIEEWCIDNSNWDSFFLWRFVNCNGDYPNWFGRCAFPSATNSLYYEACGSHTFSYTVPSCFGEIKETNIGLGEDYGRDIDYLYDVDREWLSIWCTNFSKPDSPTKYVQYDQKAPAEGDDTVGFYLEECRKAIPVTGEAEVRARDGITLGAPTHRSESLTTTEMQPLTFKVAVRGVKLSINQYEFSLFGNYMPSGYEAIIHYGDKWSIGMPLNVKVANIKTTGKYGKNWESDESFVDNHGHFVTFTYRNKEPILLTNDMVITGFKINVKHKGENVTLENIGWIAHPVHPSSTFVGYGTVTPL